MGRFSGGPRRRILMAAACTAVLLVAGCTGTTAASPTGTAVSARSAGSTAAAQSTGTAPASDTDITPHAVGSALDFECGNPIATGSTAGELAGAGAIGVPDLVYISATAVGGTRIQWGGGARYQGLYFSKVGLVLKAGAVLTLEVPAELRGHMKIGWSNSGYTLADSLSIPGCASGQANAEWLVYPGGFWLDAPACIPLTVRHGESVQTLHVPLGSACP